MTNQPHSQQSQVSYRRGGAQYPTPQPSPIEVYGEWTVVGGGVYDPTSLPAVDAGAGANHRS
jgi:hypothetical protein